MYVLGIIGYVILCLLASVWVLGVRVRLESGLGVILGSLFFTASAVVLPLSGASFLHAWWLMPVGYVVSIGSVFALDIPVLELMLKIIGSVYAGIIRIGIDPARIKAVQDAANWALIEEWSRRQESDQGVIR